MYAAESVPDYGCASCVMLRETLARNSVAHEDDLRIKTCWSDFICFNVKFHVCALVDVLIK